MKLPDAIAEIALGEIGRSEVGGTNRGKEIEKYFLADNYDPNGAKPGDDGYAWCAAFVCWVVREALLKTGVKETKTFQRPKTPGAWAFEAWSLSQDNSTSTKKPTYGDIKRGDLVIFRFSHIGIAISSPDSEGFFMTVEGNTDSKGSREGGAVLSKKRRISQIRSRIRFTI